jgi:hypothetical protein
MNLLRTIHKEGKFYPSLHVEMTYRKHKMTTKQSKQRLELNCREDVTMNSIADEVKYLYDHTELVLFQWLEDYPKDERQLQALQLVAEAGQILYAACINLGFEMNNGNNRYGRKNKRTKVA